MGLHLDGYKHVQNHVERWRNDYKYLVCFIIVCKVRVRVPLKLVYDDMFEYRKWKPQTCIWWPLHPRSMPNCLFVKRCCLLMRNCSNASTPPNDGTHMWLSVLGPGAIDDFTTAALWHVSLHHCITNKKRMFLIIIHWIERVCQAPCNINFLHRELAEQLQLWHARKVSDLSKSVLLGLLQLEPQKRLVSWWKIKKGRWLVGYI